MHRALKQMGHRVSMIAPSTEQSATGIGITSRRNLALEQLEADDVRAHMEGYITISTIKPRWNPPAKQARKLEKRLEAVTLGFPL